MFGPAHPLARRVVEHQKIFYGLTRFDVARTEKSASLAPGTVQHGSGTWYRATRVWHLVPCSTGLAPGTVQHESGTWYRAARVWHLVPCSTGLAPGTVQMSVIVRQN